MQVLPDPGPLSPKELLALTSKEAALLEALRGLFEVTRIVIPREPITFEAEKDHRFVEEAITPQYVIAESGAKAYVAARGVYLKLRDFHPDEP